MHRSKLPYVFLALSAILAVSALVLLILRSRESNTQPPSPPPPPSAPAPPEKIANIDMPIPGDTSTPTIGNALKPAAIGSQESLVQEIARALESGDITTVMRLTGSASADPLTAERLKNIAARRHQIMQPGAIRQVGETGEGQTTRWALELPGDERIYLDIKRDGNSWQIDRITLPNGDASAAATANDPLIVADTFLRSVLKQQFENSKRHIDPRFISDAKIAGLCILFEEGNYVLRNHLPIRKVLQRGDTAGFLVAVNTADGSGTAQFAMNLRQSADQGAWKIVEINLDNLLADYARKFAHGDVYYTPLVKNPEGGDTLALYFDFDSGEIDPRARRQLEIVSMILRADTGKKIRISGHTDALGTDDYNHGLSRSRAEAVRAFLAQAGVSSSQIVMNALGASQPRRPNVTETGEDNPDGRRVNRRAEIYLDF